MTDYQKFEEAFEAHLENVEDGLYGLLEYGMTLPFGGEVVSDETIDQSDSYGWTDDRLEKVILFNDFDVYVKFTGHEASYSGREWYDSYKQVHPTTKTITNYE